MDKYCIFCGKPPEKKNKEHILPQWLLRLTDMETKPVSVGTKWVNGKEIVFNLKSFTFPACQECNSKFAQIEGAVRAVMEKVLDDQVISAADATLLLDWFDKVRMSLWFAVQYLNNGTFNMPPKYFINTRKGLKDRMLAVTNCYDGRRHLWWTGVNSLAFIMSPTCFTIKINQVIFTNASSDYLVSKQLGFPYPAFLRPNPATPGRIDMQLTAGRQQLAAKLFEAPLYPPNKIICQPMFSEAQVHWPVLYANDYVDNNSYDQSAGTGKLFMQHNNQIRPLEKSESINFSFADKAMKEYTFNRPTMQLQHEILLQYPYRLDLLNEQQQRQHHENLKMIIEYGEEQVRQFNY